MLFNQLLKALDEPEQPWQAETLVLPKQHFLLQAGQIERHVYLIEEGAIRAFFLSSEGEEHILRLGYSGSLITALPSFFDGQASPLYLQTLRKTRLRKMPKNQFMAFLDSLDKGRELYREILQDLVSQQLEREMDILCFSPLERLRRVEARSPRLFQEVPAKYIASYLRMSPETLSRLRKS